MDSFQNSYESFFTAMKIAGWTDRSIFAAALFLIHLVAFYFHAWFFVFADWYGFMDRWAIRSGKHRMASMQKQWEAIREGTLDAFVVKPLIGYLVFPFAEPYISFGELPTLSNGFLQWLAMEVIFSTSLFWIHGAMHKLPIVYKYVHKRHHTYHETVSFAAQYANPLEGLASSCHIVFSILIVRPHFFMFCIFLTTTFLEIVDSHCGYDVPWSVLYPWCGIYPWGSGARAHDYHHSHNIGMYGGGLVGLWDRLFGSNKDFLRFEAQRLKKEKDT